MGFSAPGGDASYATATRGNLTLSAAELPNGSILVAVSLSPRSAASLGLTLQEVHTELETMQRYAAILAPALFDELESRLGWTSSSGVSWSSASSVA
jgi:hypothetical protein